jgi:secreted trypsin-like serine protease
MKFIVLVGFLAFASCGELGRRDDFVEPETRIIGGVEVERFQYPFMAAIIISYNGGSSGFGGGSLISENFVISAANRFKNSQSATVMLNVTHLKEDDPIIVGVVSIKVHENFGSYSFANDIGTISHRNINI